MQISFDGLSAEKHRIELYNRFESTKKESQIVNCSIIFIIGQTMNNMCV